MVVAVGEHFDAVAEADQTQVEVLAHSALDTEVEQWRDGWVNH